MAVAPDGQTAAFSAVSARSGWSFQVTVTVSDASNSRASQSVVTLQVLPSGVPLVTLTSVGRTGGAQLLNPGQSLQLVGSVSIDELNSNSNSNSTATWTADGLGQGVALAAVALTPIRVALTSRISTVYLVIPPHTLPTGTQLTFALSSGVTTTYLTVTTNAPPTPGFFG